MNQTKELEELKSIKRKARFHYNFIRSVYVDNYKNETFPLRKIYYEAINSLDSMENLYQSLKTGMRKRSLSEQIQFVEKWEEFIFCIESITAQKTNDKYLTRYINMDMELANKEAISLWMDYKKQFHQKPY